MIARVFPRRTKAIQDMVADADMEDGYFITGPSGTGKTHLAAAILRRLVAIGRANQIDKTYHPPVTNIRAEFVSVPTMLQNIQAEFGGGNPKRITDYYAKIRALVLDDLGAEKMSEWTFSALYTILSHRLNYYLPTIVTSNMSLDQIGKWEPRIKSRLGGLKVLTLLGKDQRASISSKPPRGEQKRA